MALNYGFTTMFLFAAVMCVVGMIVIAVMLPSVPRIEQPVDIDAAEVRGWKNSNVRLLFIASTLMWACRTGWPGC